MSVVGYCMGQWLLHQIEYSGWYVWHPEYAINVCVCLSSQNYKDIIVTFIIMQHNWTFPHLGLIASLIIDKQGLKTNLINFLEILRILRQCSNGWSYPPHRTRCHYSQSSTSPLCPCSVCKKKHCAVGSTPFAVVISFVIVLFKKISIVLYDFELFTSASSNH